MRSAFAGNNAPTPERMAASIEGLRRAWKLAKQPEEKSAIIAALRGLKDTKAIAAAEQLGMAESGAK